MEASLAVEHATIILVNMPPKQNAACGYLAPSRYTWSPGPRRANEVSPKKREQFSKTIFFGGGILRLIRSE